MKKVIEIVNEAKVGNVTYLHTKKKGKTALLEVLVTLEDGKELGFKNGKEFKMAKTMTESEMAAYLQGYRFFFLDGVMVDYRPGSWKGLIRDEDSIGRLLEVIGGSVLRNSKINVGPNKVFGIGRANRFGNAFLGGAKESAEFDFGGDGYQMKVTPVFKWSPFSDIVTTSLEVLRLVCANGMIGKSPVITLGSPMVNRYEEHVDITRDQILSRFEVLGRERMDAMAMEAAHIDDVQAIINSVTDLAGIDQDLMEYLRYSVDPSRCVQGFTRIPNMDLWNISTEVSTHHIHNEGDVKKIQGIASRIFFEEDPRRASMKNGIEVDMDIAQPEKIFFAA